MTKIRVHEYAKEKDVQSKLIISKLTDMGFEVKGHMSVLEDNMVDKLNKLFSPEPKTKPELTKRATGPRIKVDNPEKAHLEKKDQPKRVPQMDKTEGSAPGASTPERKPGVNPNKPSSRPTMRQHAYSSDRGFREAQTPNPVRDEQRPTDGNSPVRPQSERPQVDRPQSERPQGDRPQGQGGYQGRPQGDRPQREGGYQGRPQGDRPQGQGYQGNRPQGDRPQGQGYQGNRPQGDRPQGQGYQGNRPQGDRPQGQGYQGNRPQGDRPQGQGYQGNRPQGDRPQGQGYQGNRPQGDRPQGQGYQGNRPQGDRPPGQGYQGNRPQGDRPPGQGYQGNRPQGDRPQGQGYQGNRPQGQGYQGNRPQGDRPQGQGYQGNRPQGQGYQGNRPQGDRPQGQGYQGNRPQGQGYQGNRPQGDRPQGQNNNFGNGPKPSQSSNPELFKSNDGGLGHNPKKSFKPAQKTYVSKKAAEEKRREESKIFGSKKGQQAKQPVVKVQKELPEKITFTDSLTVAELAKKLHREASEIIKKLFMMGVMTTLNSYLEKDAIELICVDYGVEVEEIIVIDKTDLEAVIADDDVSLNTFERPAVVTIMGHVDHGKTTLLDSIRKTKVTEGEAGGITQHIGAYQVNVQDKKITFLDTPGHAAFTTMRARGAQVTDVTILVVAADDGVKPQTIEAINHAKAAGCPIVVAVNKMDKPDANLDRVKTELSNYGVVAEEWGGENIFVPIAAKIGQGIDDLLETILLVSEVAELKCNKDRLAIGTVIEAQLDKGKGPVATLLVQNGTLRIGDPIVVGNAFGKVRAMVNDLGQRITEALPSTPVEVTGLNEVPSAGDRFVVFEDEKTARQVGEQRASNHLDISRNEKSKVTLENLFETMKEGEIRELNVILKADVQGSQEAVAASLHKIEVEGVRVKIIHSGVGAISESDVILAASSSAIVIGFNVRPTVNAKRIADTEKVDIRIHNIIYNVIQEIEDAMTGMLDPEFEEKVIGQAEVRQLVKITKVGTIAGSYVLEGKIERGCKVRVIRDHVVVFEGEMDTLKRFKDDVKDVAAGYECGISIKNFNDLRELDIIEAFVMEEIKRTKKSK
ncbi:MAG: translation initiation factor [Bacillales bacterium]|nr:translation initiation factor [Bacillales bacterium]